MIDSPLVSFVIPVRNDQLRLQFCLDSIRENDYPPDLVEVIVVDNGSTDDSAHVARNAGATVLSVPHGSVAELRNLGAARARGEVLAFVDADHTIVTGWIRSAVSILSNDDVAAVGAPCHAPEPGTWVQRRYNLFRSHPPSCVHVNWLGSGNLAIKRSRFLSAGGFDGRLAACEDVDLCIRLRAGGGRIVSAPMLRSVHLGDPSTLCSLFMGELWRGRDNLRVSLRDPWNWRTAVSALAPLIGLLIGLSAFMALIQGRGWLALFCAASYSAIPVVRTAFTMARNQRDTMLGTVQTLLVAATYDTARALAIVLRASHRGRRTVESNFHATAHSRS
jgi:glycosyltransferase involved in cell wall biosynthesis